MRKSPCLKVIVPVCSVVLFFCFSLKDCCRFCLTDFAQLYLLHWAFRNYKEAAARHGQGMWYVKSWGYLLVVLVVSLSVYREQYMNIQARITLGCWMHTSMYCFYVSLMCQYKDESFPTDVFFHYCSFDVSGICLNLCCPNDPLWKFVNLPTVFFVTDTDPNENGRRKSGRESKQQAKRR